MDAKQVWRQGRFGLVFVGLAQTWGDVARLLEDTRPNAGAQLSREHVEGPRAFYIKQVRHG